MLLSEVMVLSKKTGFFVLFLISCLIGGNAWAQSDPVVGRQAARKYFKSDAKSIGPVGERYFNIHFGGFSESVSHVWGKSSGRQEDVGKTNYGVTYLLGQWMEGMDLSLRVDFISFEIDGEKPLKMSLLPLVTFPRFETGFPIYLGFGVGPGVFFKQVADHSSLSLDYQLVIGARWANLMGSSGFFLETGLKNHIHLLSEGQFNGFFMSLGGVFTF